MRDSRDTEGIRASEERDVFDEEGKPSFGELWIQRAFILKLGERELNSIERRLVERLVVGKHLGEASRFEAVERQLCCCHIQQCSNGSGSGSGTVDIALC